MMMSIIVSRRITISVFTLRCKYKNVARSFGSGTKSITDRTPISHALFLDYVASTKEHSTKNDVQEPRSSEIHDVDYLESHRRMWKTDLDKETIKLLLEKIDPTQLKQSFKVIDRKCTSIVNQLTTEEILEFLVLLVKINPSAFSRMNFYAKSIDILKTALKRHQLNRRDVLKLLFFAGVRRHSKNSDVKYIMKYMWPINEMSLIEMCIVTNILFKCSIRLSKIQARKVEETIENNAILLVSKSYWLVPLCKAVRHAGPSKKFSMNNLSHALITAQCRYDSTCISHIASLYAEAYYKNTDVLSRLYDDAFSCISADHTNIRLKDVDRLLWSGRILNFSPTVEDIKTLDIIIDRELNKNPIENHLIMNILLSLWMFDHKCSETIKRCFENKIFVPILRQKSLWKPVARLDLLLSCIRIEAPEIEIPDELQINEKVRSKINGNIKIMYRTLNAANNDLRLNELKLDCPIEGVYIIGISAKHNEYTKVHIDVLDESTSLRDSDEPHGLMNLKLRLLTKIGYQSILVPVNKMKDPEQLGNYLRDSLNGKS